jgi:hypothetical protein
MVLTGLSPQIIIPSNNNFYKILGLIPGTYPSSPSAVNVIQLSNTDVEVSPVTSLSLSVNLVNNETSVTPSIFYTFTPVNTGFGEIFSVQVPEICYVDTYRGQYSSLILSIVDEFGRALKLEDPTSVFVLALKTEDIKK